MRSVASLNYEEVQAAIDGQPNDKTAPLLEPVLEPLFAAYAALTRARGARQPLDLDLPEPLFQVTNQGTYSKGIYQDINGDGLTDFADARCTFGNIVEFARAAVAGQSRVRHGCHPAYAVTAG